MYKLPVAFFKCLSWFEQCLMILILKQRDLIFNTS